MYKHVLNVQKGQKFPVILNRFLNQLSNNSLTSHETELKSAKPFKEIPTPSLFFPLKFLPGGELYNVSFVQLHRYFHDNFGKVMKLKGILGAPDFVVIYDPNDFEKVFRTEGMYPIRSPFFTLKYHREKLRPDVYTKTGLIVSQGEEWHSFRTIVNPVMMQPKVVSLYIPKIDEVTREFIELTKKSRNANHETPADFGNQMQKWALESIGVIALDTRLGVFESKPGSNADRLTKIIDEFFSLSYQLEILPSLWRYFTTRKFAKLMKINDEMTSITMKYVEDAIQLLEAQKDFKSEEEQGVLEKLQKVDKSVAMIMAMDMLAVGIDTTSALAKALLYLLAKNPVKQEKLRQEIMTILPTKDTPLTTEKMKHIPYLRACLKETNRICPVTVGTVRKTTQDLVLQGFHVPKDVFVAMSVQLCLENEENYPKAKEFIPERWLKDDSHKAEGCPHAKDAHPFTYLPFGFGPRTCVGRRFAELEVAIFIIRFLREFNVEWHYPDLKVKSTFVEQLVGDMKFTIKDLPQ